MFKRIASLLLALMMLCTGLTIAVAEEPYEIVWQRYGSAGTTDMQAGLAPVQDAVNAWLKEHGYDFTVNMMSVRNGETIQLQLAAKDHIDLFWQNAGSLADTLIAGNFLYDIGDLYKNYEGLYNSMPESIWNTLLRNNGQSLYQIPCYKESGIATAICVKKSDAEKYGWTEFIEGDPDEIWTLDMLTPYFEQVLEAGDEYDQYLYVSPLPLTNGARDYIQMDDYAAINQYIAIDLNGEDTTVAQLVTDIPAWQDMVKLFSEWNEMGLISEGFVTSNNSTDKSWLFIGETYTPSFQSNMDDRYSKYDENGIYYKRLCNTYLGSNSALGSGYAIASYCPEVDKVLQFLDALYSNPELADLCLYGIEGEHYTRNEDGSIHRIPDSGYKFDAWATSNVMTVSITDTDAPDKKEAYAKFNEEALPSVLLGFVFDQTNVQAEVNACNQVVTEYQKLVEWGFYGEDGIEEYANALKDAGAEKVLAEVQAQLDVFFGK